MRPKRVRAVILAYLNANREESQSRAFSSGERYASLMRKNCYDVPNPRLRIAKPVGARLHGDTLFSMSLLPRFPLIALSLGALFLGACSTPPKPAPVAIVRPAPTPPPAPIVPVVHEGPNYRYVERAIVNAESEQQAPYWLTGFDNSGRERVLPADNQGVALVLQAPVGVPKLLIEDLGHNSDRIHVRIVNRGDAPLTLDVACLNRTPPIKRHANVGFPIGARSMIDLALDTPSRERSNLILRVR